jgi:hypothetical protein
LTEELAAERADHAADREIIRQLVAQQSRSAQHHMDGNHG